SRHAGRNRGGCDRRRAVTSSDRDAARRGAVGPFRGDALFRSAGAVDLHVRVRPAALDPAAAFTGRIVHLYAERVLARGTERRVGGVLPAVVLVDGRTGRIEFHRGAGWLAVHRPLHRDRRRRRESLGQPERGEIAAWPSTARRTGRAGGAARAGCARVTGSTPASSS